MHHVTTTLGGLRCAVLDFSDGAPQLLVVLCHGFGAPGDDLVPLAEELVARTPALQGNVRFLFPEAPIDLADLGNPGGRAWWPIDMEKLILRQQGVAVPEDTELPPELPRARRMLLGLIDEATRQAKLPLSRVVLGGFSQGAMLATDVALRLEEAPAALGIFSGTLVAPAEMEWRQRAPARRGLKVFQTHGMADPLLSFQKAESLKTLLEEAGLEVDFLPFRGGHTIVAAALVKFAELIAAALPAR